MQTCHSIFVHNFEKCWPIFTILSLLYSAVNLPRDLCHIPNVSLHYLVKNIISKITKQTYITNIECHVFMAHGVEFSINLKHKFVYWPDCAVKSSDVSPSAEWWPLLTTADVFTSREFSLTSTTALQHWHWHWIFQLTSSHQETDKAVTERLCDCVCH